MRAAVFGLVLLLGCQVVSAFAEEPAKPEEAVKPEGPAASSAEVEKQNVPAESPVKDLKFTLGVNYSKFDQTNLARRPFQVSPTIDLSYRFPWSFIGLRPGFVVSGMPHWISASDDDLKVRTVRIQGNVSKSLFESQKRNATVSLSLGWDWSSYYGESAKLELQNVRGVHVQLDSEYRLGQRKSMEWSLGYLAILEAFTASFSKNYRLQAEVAYRHALTSSVDGLLGLRAALLSAQPFVEPAQRFQTYGFTLYYGFRY